MSSDTMIPLALAVIFGSAFIFRWATNDNLWLLDFILCNLYLCFTGVQYFRHDS